MSEARRLEAAIDPDYLRSIVERLEGFRSHPLGFHVAGTPEEREATAFLAGEMRALGLADVVEEPVPVDAWRFTGAYVQVGGRRFECASFGGVPETGPEGIEAELVFAGRAGRRELEGLGVAGKILLVEWIEEGLWPYHLALEAGLRGALGLVVAPGESGPYYQSPGALGTFDGIWHAGAPTAVTIRRDDGHSLREHEGQRVRVVLEAPLSRAAEAANVVGVLPGRRKGTPLVMAGHHDGWFGGAFDDATGVAATLAVARAFAETGVRPRHGIAFCSHTAEEYGIAESRYDWCYGAWYQVAVERPEWGARVPFYLNVEGSGTRDPFTVDAPPELAGWCGRVLRGAERDGLLPHGWALDAPSTWTEVWTFLAAGIPGLNVSTFTEEYNRTDYHTQYDTTASVDFDYLARLTRVCVRLLVEADEHVDGLLDYGARARHLGEALGPHRVEGLERLPDLRGRAAFTAIGRGLHGLDAWERAAYPHAQTASDIDRLGRALPLLRDGRWAEAADELSFVGVNRLAADLSREAFRRERARIPARTERSTWGGQGDPDPGPDLWIELASLRGERGARAAGPWLVTRVERHLGRSRRELERRLGRMASAVAGKVPRAPKPRGLPMDTAPRTR